MTVDPTQLCQIEIIVTDLPRALAFYAGAFGWDRTPAELHEYAVLSVPAACPFGVSLVPGQTPQTTGGITLYFAVDHPQAVLAKVLQFGGRHVAGPSPVAGYGSIFRLADPDGNAWGLYTASRVLPG